MKNKKGFTLIELLAVIVILAIVTAVVSSTLIKTKKRSNIENVKTLKENALAYCTAEFIDARSLESTASLPDNSGILLSNNFYESTDTAENLTVYGTPGTFVERYAVKKGYNFIIIQNTI